MALAISTASPPNMFRLLNIDSSVLDDPGSSAIAPERCKQALIWINCTLLAPHPAASAAGRFDL